MTRRKPGARAETYWTDEQPSLQHGSITDFPADSGGEQHPKAILWVPSPEHNSGWREYYIYPKPMPNTRRLGW